MGAIRHCSYIQPYVPTGPWALGQLCARGSLSVPVCAGVFGLREGALANDARCGVTCLGLILCREEEKKDYLLRGERLTCILRRQHDAVW